MLANGNTFSAGIIATARLKYFAGVRGTIVGERGANSAKGNRRHEA
jgi:hypothetical protein